jgi:hypothetical protein
VSRFFSGLFGIGRAYGKLPPHHNFTELADNIDAFANYLLDALSVTILAEKAIEMHLIDGNGSLVTI